MLQNNKYCDDCGPLPTNHLGAFYESLSSYLLPSLSPHIVNFFFHPIEKALLLSRVISLDNTFSKDKVPLRSFVFIEEARKNELECFASKTPFGYSNIFFVQYKGKLHSFEGLPAAEHTNTTESTKIDDKMYVKRRLEHHSLPTPEGKHFWFFNAKKAFSYGIQLGFPLMIKPRNGSASRHCTFNVRDEKQLSLAIKKVFRLDPCVIVERFISNTTLFRATVVDAQFVACAKRIPANVVGDGTQTIQELITTKNKEPRRKKAPDKTTTLYHITYDHTSERLLKEHGYSLTTIPQKGEMVILQEKGIIDLGGDPIDVTSLVHPDNISLFRTIAKLFNTKLVGMDFLAEDIIKSWKNQRCAILELNSLPYIDIHHFPAEGSPQNVAKALVNMVKKYYA
ncbi:MAG: hypothetical protein HZA35_01280 [Parcubacteria group bacterium]|nr:hypothetical protein [Parcubacteria group bacterium]